jgi:hypothetical protein
LAERNRKFFHFKQLLLICGKRLLFLVAKVN